MVLVLVYPHHSYEKSRLVYHQHVVVGHLFEREREDQMRAVAGHMLDLVEVAVAVVDAVVVSGMDLVVAGMVMEDNRLVLVVVVLHHLLVVHLVLHLVLVL